MTQSTRWCFTVNADAETFYEGLETLFNDVDGIKYICGQLEKASTGQVHFQGYVQLSRSQRLNWLKSNISETAHFEKQMAKYNDQARDYTKKDDTREREWKEYGEYNRGRCPGGPSGKRNDLIEFTNAIREGGNIETLLEDGFHKELARYPRFYHTIRSRFMPERDPPIRVRSGQHL